MSDTVVGRWILKNKEKYFSGSLSLPQHKANNIEEIIHAGWKEEDSIAVQDEIKKELIKAYPNAFVPAFPNGEYPTDEDAGFQEAMRCAGPVMSRKYGEFWPQGAVFERGFKWRIIDQLIEAEKCMHKRGRRRDPERIQKSEDLVSKHGLEGLFGGLHRRRKTNKSKRGGKKRKTTRKH